MEVPLPAGEDHFCTSLWIGGASVLLAIAGGIALKRRRMQPKKTELRDVDLPLHNNELNHYSLYVE